MHLYRLLISAALLLEAVALAALAYDPARGASTIRLLALFTAATLPFLAALWLHRRSELRLHWILLGALLLRLPLLPAEPSLSDDVWRYLHDGRAQLAGVSPYSHPPAAPGTEPFRGPEHARINHPEMVTIYPPLSQLAFAAAAAFRPGLAAWKLLLLTADLALILALAALLRTHGLPLAAVALYAWHPLTAIEVAWNAHLEPIAIAPLVLALVLAARGRGFAAGFALGGSVAGKLIAAPALPFIGRRRPARALAGACIAAALLYLPYLIADPTAVLGSLGSFAARWEFNGSAYALLAALLEPRTARLAVAGAFGIALIVFWRRRLDAVAGTFATLLALLLLAPVVHPWYLLWLLPLAAVQLARPAAAACARLVALAAFAWTLTVPLAYTVLGPFRSRGEWTLPPLAGVLEYAPVYGLLAAAGLIALRSRSSRSAACPPAETPPQTVP